MTTQPHRLKLPILSVFVFFVYWAVKKQNEPKTGARRREPSDMKMQNKAKSPVGAGPRACPNNVGQPSRLVLKNKTNPNQMEIVAQPPSAVIQN
jgi:hypothetical protein